MTFVIPGPFAVHPRTEPGIQLYLLRDQEGLRLPPEWRTRALDSRGGAAESLVRVHHCV